MQIGIILICLAFPLLELAVLIKVGQSIGFWWTVLLLAGSAVAGGLIIQQQGVTALQRSIESARAGRPPLEPAVDSAFLMLAGMLFLIPGLLTDAAGFLLLIPPLRRQMLWPRSGRRCRSRTIPCSRFMTPLPPGRPTVADRVPDQAVASSSRTTVTSCSRRVTSR